eukprot:g25497.t1
MERLSWVTWRQAACAASQPKRRLGHKTLCREAVLRRILATLDRPVAVLVPRRLQEASTWAKPLCSAWIECERLDPEEAWTAVSEWMARTRQRVAGCTTLDEWGIDAEMHLDASGLYDIHLDELLRVLEKDWSYPLILKPARGAGSYYCRKVEAKDEYPSQLPEHLQELLRELTRQVQVAASTNEARYEPLRGSMSCLAWLAAGGRDANEAEQNLRPGSLGCPRWPESTNLELADLCEAWALYNFGRLCLMRIRRQIRQEVPLLRSALARLDDVEKLLIFRDPEHFLFRPLEVTTGIGVKIFVYTCAVKSLFALTVTFVADSFHIKLCEKAPWLCHLQRSMDGAAFVTSTIDPWRKPFFHQLTVGCETCSFGSILV